MGLFSNLFGKASTSKEKNHSDSPTVLPNGVTLKNDTERKMYETNKEYRELKDRTAKTQASLKYQDDLLKIACDAREKYKNDGDIESAIASYEKVMIEADPPLKNAQSHAIFLAELYIKNGQNDKAWGYLGLLQTKQLCPLAKIRGEQAKILKKEKKQKDAIEMILLQHWDRFYETEFNYYDHNACMKDIAPSIKALKWSPEDQEKCVSFVDFAVSLKQKADETTITNLYRKFVDEKN